MQQTTQQRLDQIASWTREETSHGEIVHTFSLQKAREILPQFSRPLICVDDEGIVHADWRFGDINIGVGFELHGMTVLVANFKAWSREDYELSYESPEKLNEIIGAYDAN